MRVKIDDIAKHAHVSKGTVSNYLSGLRNVSPEKGKQIQASIDELHYSVDEVARSLRTKTFNIVGVLISSFNNIYLGRIVAHIEKLLRAHNYSMLPVSFEGDLTKVRKMASFLSQRTDGIIYVQPKYSSNDNEFIKELSQFKPVVVINESKAVDGVDSIVINDEAPSYEFINDCLNKGHKEIGYIVGSAELSGGNSRMIGIKRAYSENGKEFDDEMVRISPRFEDCGKRLCNELLNEHPDITAIFVSNYRNSLGVLSELKDRQALDKVSVIGFDLEDIENLIDPAPAYIYFPRKKIAVNAVEIIMKRIAKDYSDCPEVISIDGSARNVDKISRIE